MKGESRRCSDSKKTTDAHEALGIPWALMAGGMSEGRREANASQREGRAAESGKGKLREY